MLMRRLSQRSETSVEPDHRRGFTCRLLLDPEGSSSLRNLVEDAAVVEVLSLGLPPAAENVVDREQLNLGEMLQYSSGTAFALRGR